MRIGMRSLYVLLAIAAGLASQAAFAADSQAVIQARQQLEQVREQVAAGLLPSSKLAEAQRVLDDATDESVLDQTLYAHFEIQDLTEAQAAQMIAAAQRRVDRTQAEVDRGHELIAEHVAPKDYSADAEAELARREQVLHQARDRAALVIEIVAMVHAEMEHVDSTTQPPGAKAAEEFVAGAHGLLTTKDIKDLTLAFEKKFDKPMPVSARGETAVHRALGFDHSGRIDVAVRPDSAEGKWLRTYLEKKDIPYYAFRIAIPGKATGAHIHVGPGSTRLVITD
jgi:hypothetical protein